jgi:hypothetical protein
MKANLNSILLFIAISVMGWNGYTTLQNALAIAALNVTVLRDREAVTGLTQKMDALLIELAKRPPPPRF